MRKDSLIPVERDAIPVFATDAEAAEFWDTHKPGPGILAAATRVADDPELVAEQDALRAARDAERTRGVTVRYDRDVLKRLRALAARKGTGYQTLLKQFVVERLYEEERREGMLG
jgi:uncharacterized protein (DUF4415 family)